MQAMPMINQPAVINDAVAPRATRSGNAKSDGSFAPVLEQACREDNGDELAGAAMVVQNQEGQQEVVVEPRATGQANGPQSDAKGFVATAEVIANIPMVAAPVVREPVLTAGGDIGASEFSRAEVEVAVAVENLTSQAVIAPSAPQVVKAQVALGGQEAIIAPSAPQVVKAQVAFGAQEAVIAPSAPQVVKAQVAFGAQEAVIAPSAPQVVKAQVALGVQEAIIAPSAPQVVKAQVALGAQEAIIAPSAPQVVKAQVAFGAQEAIIAPSAPQVVKAQVALGGQEAIIAPSAPQVVKAQVAFGAQEAVIAPSAPQVVKAQVALGVQEAIIAPSAPQVVKAQVALGVQEAIIAPSAPQVVKAKVAFGAQEAISTTRVVEAQATTSVQVAASVGDGGSLQLQQLNITPLSKSASRGVGTEKSNTKGTSGGSGVVVTDQRFATLLNKPVVGESLRQQQSLESPVVPSVNSSVTASEGEGLPLTLNPSAPVGGTSISPTIDSLGGGEPFTANLGSSHNGDGAVTSVAQSQLGPPEVGTARATEVDIPLKDGSSLPESRVVQQTIDHLTLHARGDSSSVTVKLHPEELGELQLRMVMEGDQLKVHLQAQSQQVQEVLERNFPRLRDALQEQGVTVDDFQVSVDSGERSDHQTPEQREFVATKQMDHFLSHDNSDDVDDAVHAVASRTDGRSISIHI